MMVFRPTALRAFVNRLLRSPFAAGAGLAVPLALAGALASAQPVPPRVYVADSSSSQVSVIDTGTNTVVGVAVGRGPTGVAASPDGTHVYVTNQGDGSVSVIAT